MVRVLLTDSVRTEFSEVTRILCYNPPDPLPFPFFFFLNQWTSLNQWMMEWEDNYSNFLAPWSTTPWGMSSIVSRNRLWYRVKVTLCRILLYITSYLGLFPFKIILHCCHTGLLKEYVLVNYFYTNPYLKICFWVPNMGKYTYCSWDIVTDAQLFRLKTAC